MPCRKPDPSIPEGHAQKKPPNPHGGVRSLEFRVLSIEMIDLKICPEIAIGIEDFVGIERYFSFFWFDLTWESPLSVLCWQWAFVSQIKKINYELNLKKTIREILFWVLPAYAAAAAFVERIAKYNFVRAVGVTHEVAKIVIVAVRNFELIELKAKHKAYFAPCAVH